MRTAGPGIQNTTEIRRRFCFQAQRLPPQKYLTKLRQILDQRLDEGELRTLCFDLGVDYDNLPGRGKADKATELIAHLERHGRIHELVEIGRQGRPDISWEYASEATRQDPSISHPLDQFLLIVRFIVLTEKTASTKSGQVPASISVAYPAEWLAVQPQTSPRLSGLIILMAVLTSIAALVVGIIALVTIVAQ